MLRRPIKYTDFNENEVTEEFYFNLTMAELIELEMNTDDGLQEWIKNIIATNDRAALFAEFKKIILSAYGEKSEDGKSFVKTPELTQAFSMTAAFAQLLLEMCTNEGKAADFILGALPRDVAQKVSNIQDQDKPIGLPNLPQAPKPPMPPTAV